MKGHEDMCTIIAAFYIYEIMKFKISIADVSRNIQLVAPTNAQWVEPVGNTAISNLPGERPSDSL